MASDGFLPKVGARLIDAGYRVVPIAPGTKQPIEPAWTRVQADKRLLRRWLDPEYRHPTTGNLTRYAEGGAGLLTENTPAVDIDVSDAEVSLALEAWVFRHVGMAPVRVGREPKRLMLCRTDVPFSKITSHAYLDGQGRQQRVEILGRGQQFVAFAIHPDTEKPYRWLYGDSPLETPADELPLLTQDMALKIRDEFHRLAEARGWARKMSGGELALAPQVYDPNNSFATDKHKVTDISEEELVRRLMLVPEPQEHDRWVQVGMALYHQYDGEDRGLELWNKWSEQASNYDADALSARWPSFDITAKGRSPMTARIILKLAEEEQDRVEAETLAKLTADLQNCTSETDFMRVCAGFKQIQVSGFLAPKIEGLVQARYKVVFGTPLTIGRARQFIRYEAPPNSRETPMWLAPYVYDREREEFFDPSSGLSSSISGFNAAHNRHMLTRSEKLEGKSTPDVQASDAALNLYEISTVSGRRYDPQGDKFINIDGVDYLNTYSDRGVPVMPDEYSAAERAAIARVERHFGHLFGQSSEVDEFRRFLAHIIRGGERVSWAPLLQGTEKDGKSFFYELLEVTLGKSNVARPSAEAINEQYNPWAEGNQVVFFEEVKVAGHRYDVMNRLKPMLTNSTVAIRRMRTDTYDVPNVTCYIFATNHKDALPLAANDTRYLVLVSRFQTKEAIEAFMAAEPDYYDLLYATLKHAGALRKHFGSIDIGSFNPKHRASDSAGRRQMVLLARDEIHDTLDDLLERPPAADCSAELMNSLKLSDAIHSTGAVPPQTSKLARLLSEAGFTQLGRFRIAGSDNKQNLWSRTPERFTRGGGVQVELIQHFIATWTDDRL